MRNKLAQEHSLATATMLLGLLAVAAAALGMALPLVRHLYERPVFLWISMALALGVGALLIAGPIRAKTSAKRKLFFIGLAVGLVGVQAIRLYHDYGSPSLWVPSPQVLAFFRELVHILEYGFLAFVASRLLQAILGGPILYLTAFAYAFVVGIFDETVQWLHAFRVGDLRDVIANGISACIGLLYRAGLAPAPSLFNKPVGMGLAVVFLVLSPVLLVEFYARTQTGHRICDEMDNCFFSHFTSSGLEAEGKQRAERWAGFLPGALESEEPSFWAWEDYYLTEARAHLRSANQALTAGDGFASCGELHILTSFYAPSVAALGARPQDYRCSDPTRGYDSQAFSHLDTNTPARMMRGWGAGVGLLLGGLTALFSRSRRTSAVSPD